MNVRIEGSKLIIELDIHEPVPSSSGKTVLIAGTRGNKKTGVFIEGKEITIGANAYLK